MMCTRTSNTSEGEAQALEVAERARFQQGFYVCVRRAHRQRQPTRTALRLLWQYTRYCYASLISM